MSSAITYKISTSSSADTQDVAHHLAKHLMGGEVIQLVSDLGGGKTTFVQGLARGLGFSGDVTSPTFTISQIYRISPQLELHHYDFYRLGEAGVVGEEMSEDLKNSCVITIIEWPDVVGGIIPEDCLSIEFEVTGIDSRDLIFNGSGPVSNQLIESLSK